MHRERIARKNNLWLHSAGCVYPFVVWAAVPQYTWVCNRTSRPLGYTNSLRQHSENTDPPNWNCNEFAPEVSRVSSALEMQSYRPASADRVIAPWLHSEGNSLPFNQWTLLSWIAPAACVLLRKCINGEALSSSVHPHVNRSKTNRLMYLKFGIPYQH
jgi:hypothetical protein